MRKCTHKVFAVKENYIMFFKISPTMVTVIVFSLEPTVEENECWKLVNESSLEPVILFH